MTKPNKEHRRSTPAHSKASKKLVSQRLGLGDSAQPPVVHLLGVQLHGAFRELETLLNHGSQLTNPATLLTYIPNSKPKRLSNKSSSLRNGMKIGKATASSTHPTHSGCEWRG